MYKVVEKKIFLNPTHGRSAYAVEDESGTEVQIIRDGESPWRKVLTFDLKQHAEDFATALNLGRKNKEVPVAKPVNDNNNDQPGLSSFGKLMEATRFIKEVQERVNYWLGAKPRSDDRVCHLFSAISDELEKVEKAVQELRQTITPIKVTMEDFFPKDSIADLILERVLQGRQPAQAQNPTLEPGTLLKFRQPIAGNHERLLHGRLYVVVNTYGSGTNNNGTPFIPTVLSGPFDFGTSTTEIMKNGKNLIMREVFDLYFGDYAVAGKIDLNPTFFKL